MSGALHRNFYNCLLKGCTALGVFFSFRLLLPAGFVWVLENPEFHCDNSRTGKSWKKVAGPGKFLKSVTPKYKNMKCIAASKEN